jgi:hypothetical protein
MKWRAETPQPGLEFDNFKPRLKSGIFKCISWLNGSFFGGWWSGYSESGSQDLSNVTNFFCLYIYSLWVPRIPPKLPTVPVPNFELVNQTKNNSCVDNERSWKWTMRCVSGLVSGHIWPWRGFFPRHCWKLHQRGFLLLVTRVWLLRRVDVFPFREAIIPSSTSVANC